MTQTIQNYQETVNTLLFALRSIAPNGWIVIEDVMDRVLPGLAIADRIVRDSPELDAQLVRCSREPEMFTNFTYVYVLHRRVA